MAAAWKFPFDLAKAPLVLAGPMLRKVTKDSVTVWFALKKPAMVRLKVEGPLGLMLTGERHTVALGTNLHIVAVTADVAPLVLAAGTTLVEGAIYTYDATFQVDGVAASVAMGAATNDAKLGYFPYKLPTFCLPPSDLNKLRLIHGSCRHPNAWAGPDVGGGEDGLALLSELIDETVSHPDLRPHQLLLTGDQIYADDVAGQLLMAITAASDLLLGWQELLPLPPIKFEPATRFPLPPGVTLGGPRPGNKSPPYTRTIYSEAIGLTSDASSCHLFSLGEYICMYLFVWSDVLWDIKSMPPLPVVEAAAKADPFVNRFALGRFLEEDNRSLIGFREELSDVRCALANIPTYMMMDDHDVTDDFNMEREFFQKVYAKDNPMGLRVIQNGLTAYALCQHWGNVPEAFATGSGKPGEKLLLALDGLTDKTIDARSRDQADGSPGIMRLVGVHDLDAMRAFSATAPNRSKGLAVFHDANSLTYNYTIEGPMHQVIVTDSRTWRLMPDGKVTPELLPKDQIERQITNITPKTVLEKTPTTPEVQRLLFVVVSTNAPPFRGIRFAGNHSTTTYFVANTVNFFTDPLSPNDQHQDLYEAWELPSAAFDRLIKAISDRMPTVTDAKGVKTKRGGAVLLSGDVHHAFSTRLIFSASNRFEDTGAGQPAEVVVAQMVASALRNNVGRSIAMHDAGYNFMHFSTQPEGHVGWNTAPDKDVVIGTAAVPVGAATIDYPISVKGRTTTNVDDLPDNLILNAPAHYTYILDYVTAREVPVNDLGLLRVPANPPNPTAAQRKASADLFKQISANYRAINKTRGNSRDIVGVNNIGEVTVNWGAGDAKSVNHTVRWINWHNQQVVGDKVRGSRMATTYTISLNPSDRDARLNATLPPVKAKP